MRTYILLVFLAFCGNALAHSTRVPTRCEQLPKMVTSAVSKAFPRAHVVTLNDLDPEDAKIWSEAHGNQCPGWVSGSFRPGGSQYALTIVQGVPGKLSQALLVVDVDRNHNNVLILSPMQPVARVSVVRQQRVGRSRLRAIVYESIESDYIVYSWTGNEFKATVSTDLE
jgi:hypothetical protein